MSEVNETNIWDKVSLSLPLSIALCVSRQPMAECMLSLSLSHVLKLNELHSILREHSIPGCLQHADQKRIEPLEKILVNSLTCNPSSKQVQFPVFILDFILSNTQYEAHLFYGR